MDDIGWQRILASNCFGMANGDLRKAFANLAKKLCMDSIETQTIEAILSYFSNVREVLRRIGGEIIVSVLKDIINCTISLQVCGSQEAGIGAAVHSLNSMYNNESNDAVLLVDASNVFNLI